MVAPYKRRRPALLPRVWAYRYVLAATVVLGVIGWFCWSNSAAVTVALPFGLGRIEQSLGVVILLSAMVGSLATALVFGVILALLKLRSGPMPADEEEGASHLGDDRPPSDYASKTGEGFQGAPWSRDL